MVPDTLLNSLSREQLQAVIDSISMPLIIHYQGQIEFSNKIAKNFVENVFGEEIVGKNIIQFIHPEDRARTIERMSKISIGSTEFDIFDFRVVGIYGDVTDIETKASRLWFQDKLYNVVLIENIRDKYTLPEEWVQNKEFIDKIHKSIPELICVWNPQTLEVKYTNLFSNKFLGYSSTEFGFLGENHLLESSTETFKNCKQQAKSLKSGLNSMMLLNMLSKNGNEAYVLLNTSPFDFDENKKLRLVLSTLVDVTEYQVLQMEKMRSEDIFNSFAKGMEKGMVITVNEQQNIISMVGALKLQLGIQKKKYLNQPLSKFNKDYNFLNKKLTDQIGKTENPVEVSYECVYNSRILSVRKIPVESSVLKERIFIIIIQDITETRLSAKELEQAKSTQSAIIHAMPDFIIRLSKRGVHLEVYPSLFHTHEQYSPDKLIGKTLGEVLPKNIAQMIKNGVKNALESGKIESVYYDFKSEGNDKHYEARISPLNTQEVIVIIRDISHEIVIQRELDNKLVELERKNAELELYVHSNAELERFAFIASHDLKEPIRSIVSFAQLAKYKMGQGANPEVLEFFSLIEQASKRMDGLIQGLLDFSRARTHGKPFFETDLNVVVEKVLQDLNAFVEDQASVISIKKLPTIIADEQQMRQLFQNLIGNAIKFAQKGNKPMIEISSTKQKNDYLIKIKDNGIGIESKDIHRIFEIFNRLHTYDLYPGSGIGLSLCKRIVERHGGKIGVTSKPGEGSTFFFTLPKNIS